MCGRCVFTTVNPHDGSRDPNGDPLKTLKTFRLVKNLINFLVVAFIQKGLVNLSFLQTDYLYPVRLFGEMTNSPALSE